MVTSFSHNNDVTDRLAASVRLFVFYLSLGQLRVCEIEISHMGKNNGNPDLVCEKELSQMGKNSGNLDLVCENTMHNIKRRTYRR